jgi:hypothetical protein
MKKKGAAKKARKGKKVTRRFTVVVDRDAAPSPYAKYATRVFSKGVQRAYADLASKGIRTVVIENGRVVRAVPRRVDGAFTVMEPNTTTRHIARKSH